MSVYQERMAAFLEYPWDTGPVPNEELRSVIRRDLGEYYRRTVKFNPPTLYVIPMPIGVIVEWAGGTLTAEDLARVEDDDATQCQALRAKKGHMNMTTGNVFKTILLWSLLVDRGKLALIDDPSVPMLRIFAAGYELRMEGNELALWGEVPWTIRLHNILKDEGLIP